VAPVVPVTPAAAPMPAWEAQPSAAGAATKKSPAVPIGIAVAVLLLAGGGYFVMRSRSSAPPKAAPAPVNRTASASPLATAPLTASTPAATGTVIPAPGTVAPTTTAPAIDAGKVDEEVKKRLAAERTRLDQLARQQQTTTQAPVLGRTTPQPQPPPQPQITQTVAPAPQPVVPAPQPVVPAPQPAAPQPAPEPQPARTQVGELVEPGTPGLVPATMLRQALATYPPIAKMQHIQGSVTINALVSEGGQVVETRVLSSANPVLNDAAVQSVRRSTFNPGMKDGVRVKSWTPVRVDFKL
jgi:TonB family protein